MTVEYIRYRLDDARREEFVEAYRAAAAELADSEVCLGYELAQCEEEADRFTLRIIWTSTGSHAASGSWFAIVRTGSTGDPAGTSASAPAWPSA